MIIEWLNNIYLVIILGVAAASLSLAILILLFAAIGKLIERLLGW